MVSLLRLSLFASPSSQGLTRRHGCIRRRRLKALEGENARLKKLLAEQMLDNAILKDVASKNVWSAPALQGFLTAVERSLRKCIRPLASGLLLQPGHDEMRAHRSH